MRREHQTRLTNVPIPTDKRSNSSKKTKDNKPKNKKTKNKRVASPLIFVALLLFLFLLFVTVFVNNFHAHKFLPKLIDSAKAKSLADFKKGKISASDVAIVSSKEMDGFEIVEESANFASGGGAGRSLANSFPGTLSCNKDGDPNDSFSQFAQKEMVYWSNIPYDSFYRSPYVSNNGEQYNKKTNNQARAKRMYLSFEFDGGGWNNIRMSTETYLSLAMAMGRTLIMPPRKHIYLLGRQKGDDQAKQQVHFSFADFFPIEKLAKDNDVPLNIISMEEFLETEAMTGNLIDNKTGNPSFPPNNKTAWDEEDYDELRFWLRNVTHVPMDWHPNNCLAVFPISGDYSRSGNLTQDLKAINDGKLIMDSHQLVNVSDPVIYRMKDNLAKRKKLCFYDRELQNAPVIHFICSHKLKIRMLTHFYSFLLFENWKEDLWMKRFIRDHVRYDDHLQVSAPIVAHIKKIRRGLPFSCLHKLS